MNDLAKILKYIFPFWKKYWRQELIVFILLGILLVLNLFIPLQFQKTIDAIVQSDENFYSEISIFIALILITVVITWGYDVIAAWIGESVIINITSQAYNSILYKKRSFWQQFYPNDILTRLTQDILSVKA